MKTDEELLGHVQQTARGFDRIEFSDIYGALCSLQESSLATKDAVWLGENGSRMHLDRALAAKVIASLQHWVDTGSLRRLDA